MESQVENSRVVNNNSNKTLERYKKKLLIQVIIIFIICLIIILQRVFYELIVESEEITLAQLQRNSGLVYKNDQNETVPKNIDADFLQFYAFLGEFHIQLLFVTHILVTFYVSVDSIIGAKLMYVTMAVIYLTSLIQMFYSGGRPFWQKDQILTAACLRSYNQPSLGMILFLLLPTYSFYCWRRRIVKIQTKLSAKEKISLGAFVFLALVIQFFNYFLGEIFLINIAMSFIFFSLIYMGLTAINSGIDTAVKKSTILRIDAKKYVFYWLLLICLLQTFVLIVYSGLDLFLDIDWVQNYLSCTKYLDYSQKKYRFDEVIGPWFNFIQTSCIFAWIGGIFGIAACFRAIESIEWSSGTITERVKRGIIANLFIVPSWLFVILFENNGSWVQDIGLNEFIVDGVHFFLLYIWLFGYMPILVLHKFLRLTNKDSQDFYVIRRDKSEQSLENHLIQKQQG